MKVNGLCLVLIFSGLLLLCVQPGHAWNKGEAKCRAETSRGLARYTSTQLKNIGKCHRLRNKRQLPEYWDCNDPDTADREGKAARAERKLRRVIGGAGDRCSDKLSGEPFERVLANFSRCPSPAEEVDDGGATTGIDDYEELADCLVALGKGLAGQLGGSILGSPLPREARPGARRCHWMVAKLAGRYVGAVQRVRGRAQVRADRSGGDEVYGQAGVDVHSKIGKAESKLAGNIYKKCGRFPAEDLDAVRSCADTAEGIADCVVQVARRTARGLAALGFELPARCPTRAMLTARAGSGDELTDTRLDVGFSGLSHSLDIMDGIVSAVSLDCDTDCTDCAVSEEPLKDLPAGLCRCEDDPTVRCDTIAGPDADDCGGAMCRCMFGPPLAIAAGGVPVCVLNELAGDLSGSADAGTGAATVSVGIRSKVHLGGAWLEPCPVCAGDGVINDGYAGGVCRGGQRDGLACDANATDLTFGSVSYECLPEPGTGITGSGLELAMTMTNGSSSLPFGTVCDAPAGSLACACAVCSGDSSVVCNDDQVCKDIGAGTCSSNGGGATRLPNQCNDGVCNDLGDGNGQCGSAGPVENYCDGLLRSNGRGLLSCQTDADCDAYQDLCPNGYCGFCSVSEPRGCFLDPINVSGRATPDAADIVTTFCVPPTGSAAVNSAVGLPGAARFKVAFDIEGQCANGAPFDKPGGSNCM